MSNSNKITEEQVLINEIAELRTLLGPNQKSVDDASIAVGKAMTSYDNAKNERIASGETTPSVKETQLSKELNDAIIKFDIETRFLEATKTSIAEKEYALNKIQKAKSTTSTLQSNAQEMNDLKGQLANTTEPQEQQQIRSQIQQQDGVNSQVSSNDKNNRTVVTTDTNTLIINKNNSEELLKSSKNNLDKAKQDHAEAERKVQEMIEAGNIEGEEFEMAKADVMEKAKNVSNAETEYYETVSSISEGDTDTDVDEATEETLAPEGEEAVSEDIDVVAQPYVEPDKRVKLRPMNRSVYQSTELDSVLQILNETDGVIFPYTPDISIDSNVNYSAMDVTHANQDFHFYNNTPATRITINGTFTAQNRRDAEYLFAVFHFFRAVTKMRFGSDINGNLDEKRGAPPPMLLLSGYGDLMMNDLPVIVTSFNMPFPSDVDYIETEIAGIKVWVPSVATLSVSLVVQNTPKKLREFNWDDFASGKLLDNKGWF